jgi:hypothetical protein
MNVAIFWDVVQLPSQLLHAGFLLGWVSTLKMEVMRSSKSCFTNGLHGAISQKMATLKEGRFFSFQQKIYKASAYSCMFVRLFFPFHMKLVKSDCKVRNKSEGCMVVIQYLYILLCIPSTVLCYLHPNCQYHWSLFKCIYFFSWLLWFWIFLQVLCYW